METYLEGEEITARRTCARSSARRRSTSASRRCSAAPPSRTRACSRCSTPSSTTCRRRSTCRPSRHRARTATRSTREPADDAPFAALAFKVAVDPYVGKLTYFRVYSGTLKAGLLRPQLDQGQARAHQPHPADARQPPRGPRRDLRRRARRRRRAQVHRRPATRCARRTSPIILESMEFPEPVISVAIEPKTKADEEKLGNVAAAPRRGGPDLPRAHRRGDRADDHRGHGRAAPRDHRRPPAARVQRRRQRRPAAGRLPRDHPQARSRRSRAGSSARPAAAASTATWSSTWSPTHPGDGYEFESKIVGGVDPARVHPVGRRRASRRR